MSPAKPRTSRPSARRPVLAWGVACALTGTHSALAQETYPVPALPPWWSVEGEVIQEIGSVVSGGVRERTSNRHLILVTSFLDLAGATGRDGAGSIGINFQSAPPNSGGSQDIGDIQIASNIETDRSLDHFMELWYETDFGGGPWRIKAGKTDANGDFAVPLCAARFSHSSAGFSPTIFPLPTYPEPATGIDVFYEVAHERAKD